MATGSAILDFGAAPGAWDASVDVTGQAAILSGSHAEAFLMADDTVTSNPSTGHSPDEHVLAGMSIRLTCGAVVAGTGFTIFAVADGPIIGTFAVRWVWA